MISQAVFNLRTVKDAYRAFCGKHPDTGDQLQAITVDTLAAALHFLEVGACASSCTYDPTVPEHAKFAILGAELAERSGAGAVFSLKKLTVAHSRSLQECCVEAIEQANPLLLPLTATPQTVVADEYHSPLDIDSPKDAAAGWRRNLSAADMSQASVELAEKVLNDTDQFYGSKCLVGVLGAPDGRLADQLKSIVSRAGDAFLLDHLIPMMIQRFRLHFLPGLARRQQIMTVPFFDPRLATLCKEHAEHVATFLARGARESADDRGGVDLEQFRRVFESAPLALLALLMLKDNVKTPSAEPLFERALLLRDQIKKILATRQLVPGQLIHELNPAERERFEEWVSDQLPTSPIIEPRYCRVVKWGVPIVFARAGTVASGLIGGLGGEILDTAVAAAGPRAGEWLGEVVNPHRKFNIAIRNFTEIQDHWRKLTNASDLIRLLRAKVYRHLGLNLEVP